LNQRSRLHPKYQEVKARFLIVAGAVEKLTKDVCGVIPHHKKVNKMGFLDHATNNIIIDAVLTDTGRRKLADNNGSFKIAFFSLADDEVDYSIIEQFGRTVGKEKITKNTPVFEAQTTGDIALKYRLLTLSDPTVINLPTLSLAGSTNINSGGTSIGFGRTSNTQQTINVKQTIQGNIRIPDGASDQSFTVFVPDRFLLIPAKSYISIDPTTRVAMYHLQAGTPSANNGATAAFTLAVQPGLDDTAFTIYGDGTTITSVMSIVGDGSGIRKDIEVTITK
jgi:hypothetical protein